MRNIYLLLLFFSVLGSGYAQQNNWGTLPSGYNHREDVIAMATTHLPAPTSSEIANAKKGNAPRAGEMYLIGLDIPVSLNPTNAGIWTGYAGYKTWRLKIKSAGAEALLVRYSTFDLPESTAVYVYNSTFTHKSHAYQRQENPSGTHFSTEVIVGDEMILEYNAPEGMEEMPRIEIEGIGYIFREGHTFQPRNYQNNGSSDPCQVNVNCPEGNNWQNQQRGIVKMLMPSGGGYGLCTGSLVNNTGQNCRNYVLTAQHCGASTSASGMNQWQFYFNFESSTCANLNTSQANAVDNQVLTGCKKRSASGTNASDDVEKSDFLLIELNSSIPSAYNVYYNGWDRNNTAATSGVGIHHPSGDIKKISTYSSNLISGAWGSTSGSHWRVTWIPTANGHGVTEGGSSGSPIFNQSKRIVGDLSGGSSYCHSPSAPDLYGKFYYSWDLCGATAALRLKPWLDSAGTNVTTLDGRYACNLVAVAPVANFTANITSIMTGGTVNFTQTCTNNPTTFGWSITPNTGWSYQSGSSASSPNPAVQFNTAGQYTVTLAASNSAGSDDETKTNYILVYSNAGIDDNASNLAVNIYPNPATDILYIQLEKQTTDPVSIKVIDMLGKTIAILEKPAGTESIQIPTEAWAQGIYQIEIQSGKFTHIQKIIKG